MNDYTEVLIWKDGTIENYEVTFENDYRAEQYAREEFERYPEVIEYRVFRERITVARFTR